MPRRYSDYPDAYFVYNMISRWGSLVSFVALVGFLFIVWERVVRQRRLVFPGVVGTAVEWRGHVWPIGLHNFDQNCFGVLIK